MRALLAILLCSAAGLAMLPRQRGCVSVLDIEQQKISAVRFACDQGGLAALVR